MYSTAYNDLEKLLNRKKDYLQHISTDTDKRKRVAALKMEVNVIANYINASEDEILRQQQSADNLDKHIKKLERYIFQLEAIALAHGISDIKMHINKPLDELIEVIKSDSRIVPQDLTNLMNINNPLFN